MILEKITLLSRNEFKRYQPLIPKTTQWWWLKTALDGHKRCVHIIDNCGDLYISGCGSSLGGVRPLCILRAELSDTVFWYKSERIVGTNIKHGNCMWTVLDIENSEIYALCDKLISKRCFDADTNDWETSELRIWLKTIGLMRITS